MFEHLHAFLCVELSLCLCIITENSKNLFTRAFLRVQVNEVQHLIERISLCVEEVKLRHSNISTEINPPNCEYIEFVSLQFYIH